MSEANDKLEKPNGKCGRPPFTQATKDKILGMLAEGMTLTAACRSEEGMPDVSTVCMWAKNDDGFSKQYARAREIGYLVMADQLADIADDGLNDYVEVMVKGHEVIKLDGEHVQRSKLRVDTRKWLLSKVLPKIYGDKSQMNVSIGGSEKPVLLAITRRIVDPADAS